MKCTDGISVCIIPTTSCSKTRQDKGNGKVAQVGSGRLRLLVLSRTACSSHADTPTARSFDIYVNIGSIQQQEFEGNLDYTRR